jgi:hypothetical protein
VICQTQFARAAGVRAVCNRAGIGCPIFHADGHLDYVKIGEGYALPVEDNSDRGYHLMWDGKDPLRHPSVLCERDTA